MNNNPNNEIRKSDDKACCILGSSTVDLGDSHGVQPLYMNLFLLIGLLRSLGHNQFITGLQDGIERQTAFQLVRSADVFKKHCPLTLSFYLSDAAINTQVELNELETAREYGEQLSLAPSCLQGVTHWLLIGIAIPHFLEGCNVMRLSIPQLQMLPSDLQREIIEWAIAPGWVGTLR